MYRNPDFFYLIRKLHGAETDHNEKGLYLFDTAPFSISCTHHNDCFS